VKVYISGPMTGLPDYNRAAFRKAEARLLSRGYDVVNPARVNLPESSEWIDYMRHDIKMLMDCDGIATLPGWDESRGALTEVFLADRLKLPAMDLELWLLREAIAT